MNKKYTKISNSMKVEKTTWIICSQNKHKWLINIRKYVLSIPIQYIKIYPIAGFIMFHISPMKLAEK